MGRDSLTGSRQAEVHQTASEDGFFVEPADPRGQSSARRDVALELMRQRHLNEELSAKLEAMEASNKVL
jgi:hypothetical protein